jgi:hypothetical protein
MVLVFVVSWTFRLLSTTSFHNDQYMHLAWANQVLAGELPGRDFVDPGMPLTYLASAAAQLLLGRGAWAEAVWSLTLLSTGAALTCHLASRASGSLVIGLIAALIQIVIAPRLYSAPKIALPLLAIWAFWRYTDRPTRRSLAVLAGCTALAFLVRHDHGAYIWAAATVLLIHFHRPTAARQVATYSVCVALLLLPFFAYVQSNEGIVGYLRAGLAFSEAEFTGRRVDLQPRFDLSSRVPEAPVINIRWASTIDATTRARVEVEHSLEDATYLRDQTWQYRLADVSENNVRSLINQREVEDTAGIDRGESRVSGINETTLDRLGRAANQRGAPWLTTVLKRENAIAWMYLLFTWVPVVALVLLVVAQFRPSWRFQSGQMTASVVVAAAVLGVVTNEGFLRDPLDVRLADSSAVTLILTAWLIGLLRPTVSLRGHTTRDHRRELWPRSAVAVGAMTLMIAATGATLLSAAELGSLQRLLEKTRFVEGPRLMARGAWHTISSLNTRPPIDGWLASGDEQRELKELTRYVRECTRPDERLLVTWFAPEVYFYSERLFAAGYAFFYPGFFSSPAEEEVALARLRAQSVPIALLEVTSYEASFARDHPLLARHLAERYAIAGEVAAADGSRYRVMADRRAVPVRVSSPWSLPCFQ